MTDQPTNPTQPQRPLTQAERYSRWIVQNQNPRYRLPGFPNVITDTHGFGRTYVTR